MNSFYIVLSEDFYNENQGQQVGNNVLNIVQTNDGRYVTSSNALNEFPGVFSGLTEMPEIVMLATSDFPQPEPPFPSPMN